MNLRKFSVFIIMYKYTSDMIVVLFFIQKNVIWFILPLYLVYKIVDKVNNYLNYYPNVIINLD